jgi:hypothetical protein
MRPQIPFPACGSYTARGPCLDGAKGREKMRADCKSGVRATTVFVAIFLLASDGARGDFRFGVPRDLRSVVNSSGSDGSPEISADGPSLYFGSTSLP